MQRAAGEPWELAANERTRVVRLPGGSVVRKEARGPDAVARVRHEAMILERVAGVDGVTRLAGPSGDPVRLLLCDVPGPTLAEAGRLDDAELRRVALGLATVLAGVHAAGVIHRDVNPANVVLTGPGRRPVLLDFDLATTFAEVRPGFTHHRQIAGRLPYLAPEQTGRTAQPVDLRADLYGLGATLYELATGAPPFGDGDALGVVRDILARTPVPPADAVPGFSAGLSAVVAHLLEKEPDRRYQSAAGLVHDLTLLAGGDVPGFTVGARDFPLRLLPPSTLIGRDAEIRALHRALDQGARGVLVAGPAGVGKSALAGQLAATVTARGGWFVAARYDQFRQDSTADPVVQVLRSLARLLLAEDEADLAAHRARILDRLGTDAGLAVTLVPELAALLGTGAREEDRPDPLRTRRVALDLLRAVAAPERPVVLVLDDLQWAGDAGLRFVDAVLSDPDLPGLLLVGGSRDVEQPRWDGLEILELGNLGPADQGRLLAEMLRLPEPQARALALVLAERCAGNPYTTVELVNALRADGVLTAGPDGWQWDEQAIRRHVGSGDVADLLTTRIDRLPAATRRLLALLACLGGDATPDLLDAAGDGLSGDDLAPALEDGLLVTDDRGTVRFRHDRVRQAAGTGVGTPDHLDAARRLAATGRYDPEAAEQYLAAVDDLTDPAERTRAAGLFEAASRTAVRVGNHAVAERYLAAAVTLTGDDDPPVAARLATARHAALYNMGRLTEADAVYARVETLCADPLDLVDAACVQVSSLTNRTRPADAVVLGLALLARLGLAVPERDLDAEVEDRLDGLYRWIDRAVPDDDIRRPEITDRWALAAGRLINRLSSPAFFSDQHMLRWLVVQAQALWARYGPCAPLIAPIAYAGHVTVSMRGDYATGVRIMRHVLAVAEGRDYTEAVGHARFLLAVTGRHWFEPVDDTPAETARAREELVRGGDLLHACLTYLPALSSLLDTAPSLDVLSSEVDAALAFAARTGNETARGRFMVYRRLIRQLRGEPADDDAGLLDRLYAHVLGKAYLHIHQALAAAVFGEPETLRAEAEAATALLPEITGIYPNVAANLMRALALARRLRDGDDDARPELAAIERWFAERAHDMPGNFRHLLRLVEAERAWADGDVGEAQLAFDAGLRDLDARVRPWHRALTAERAGLFHLEYGLDRVGHGLLAEARQAYRDWGAAEKVRRLDRQFPALRARPDRTATHSLSMTADDLEMVAILRASQAISSETSLDRLHTSVVEHLRALTGATAVQVLVLDESAGWAYLEDDVPDAKDDASLPVEQAAARRLLPLSVFRYVERTGESLLVPDAALDERFRRDPYFAGLDRCSLLAVPIVRQGQACAMLILQNRLSAGAFTADRLDAVLLIAGQLAVSVRNAQVYRLLEERVADRTRALSAANERLEELTRTDALTGVANRRRFDALLAAAWTRAADDGTPVGLVMLDIDHFKSYNDRYGHPAGDACLRLVARAIAAVCRTSEVVCRYGGEEFAVVLPGADAAQARAVADRVRATVADLAEPHAGAERGIVTVSVGVTSGFPDPGTAPGDLVDAADGALYEAKQNGRDQVRPAR